MLALFFSLALLHADLPAVVDPVVKTPAPRALSWCIALLEGPGVVRLEPAKVPERGINAASVALRTVKETAETPETPARMLIRAVRRLFRKDPVRLNLPRVSDVAVRPELEAKVSAAFARLERTRRDLTDLPAHAIPVSHVIEGDVAIRAYLADLRARAAGVQRELEIVAPERAPRRPAHAGKFLKSTLMTGLYGGVTYAWALLTIHVGMHHHLAVAAGMSAGYGFVFGKTVIARFNRLYLNLRGGYEAITGRTRPTTALEFAREQLAVADDITAALDDGDDERVIYSANTIELPLRQWDFVAAVGGVKRTTPTAAELRAAVASHGWHPPVDARRLEADLVFIRPRPGRKSTLISIVREPTYLQDR